MISDTPTSTQESNNFRYEMLKRNLEFKLINYLNHYIKKGFRMNLIFHSIVRTLKNRQEISKNQFNSIIKFLDKEKEFRGLSQNKIYCYFSPIINIKNRKEGVNTLEDFLTN